MDEVKSVFRRLGGFLLILMAELPFTLYLIPDTFPMRNVTSVYWLFVSVCLFVYYRYRVVERGAVKIIMQWLAAMLAAMILLRGLKYSVFFEIGFVARHLWYLYYVPTLLIPQCFLLLALFIRAEHPERILKRWGFTLAASAALILLVLTNDLHQSVFIFKPGFENWDSDYTHGIPFYIVIAWAIFMYIMTFAVLLYKCRVGTSRKNAWLVMVPFFAGGLLLIILLTGNMPLIDGSQAIQFPETVFFMVASVVDCCMQIGLIPTNQSYREFISITSVPMQITDKSGDIAYRSSTAAVLSSELIFGDDKALIGENTLLHKAEVSGGYGFWEEDITEQNRLQAELEDVKERLAEEGELVILQNKLKEKQAQIEHRSHLYDEIALHTEPQSLKITILVDRAKGIPDSEEKNRIINEIIMLGAYIKRYANLLLLANGGSGEIQSAELALSVAETLHYLNYYGTPGEILNTSSGTVPGYTALTFYETFERLLEKYLTDLAGVYVNISSTDEIFLFKLTMEGVSAEIPSEIALKLAASSITIRREVEDDTTYFKFAMAKGGKNV